MLYWVGKDGEHLSTDEEVLTVRRADCMWHHESNTMEHLQKSCTCNGGMNTQMMHAGIAVHLGGRME